jgi:alkylation response protein AidB-like acyl-CoA dehydrogenase
VENVVHLILARIKGAPRGVKGISLFVVPKKRPTESGELVSNDLAVTAVYHKLGYKGAPITQLSMGDEGDCRGFLVGEPHKGLSYMFQMMNEPRPARQIRFFSYSSARSVLGSDERSGFQKQGSSSR